MKNSRFDWIIGLPLVGIVFIVIKYLLNDLPIDATFVMVDLIAITSIVLFAVLHLKHFNDWVSKMDSDWLEHQKQIDYLQSTIKRQQDVINEHEGKALEVEKDAAKIQAIITQTRSLQTIKGAQGRIKKLLPLLAGYYEVSAGVVYTLNKSTSLFDPVEKYALDKSIVIPSVERGIGLCGEVILTKEVRVISSIPDEYLVVTTGLGEAKPCFLTLLPIIFDDNVVGLIELASFKMLKIDAGWNELNSEIANLLAKD